MREFVTPPGYQSTEVGVEATKNSLLPYLFSQIEAHDTFVDEIFEDQTGDYIARCTDFLCKALCGDNAPINAQYAASQAFFFAYRTSLYAAGGRMAPRVDIGHYNQTVARRLEQSPPQSSMREAIRDIYIADSDDYFVHNPVVSDLVMYYLDFIDPSGEHYAVARTTAGLTFLQIELGAEKQYIDTHLALYEQELTDKPKA